MPGLNYSAPYAFLFLAVLGSSMCRQGMIDAFEFKKTKRQRRDGWNHLNLLQKIILPYGAVKDTNAPWHMKLFCVCRRIHAATGLLNLLAIFLVRCVGEWFVNGVFAVSLVKTAIVDLPMMVYGIFSSGGGKLGKKRWNFENSKHP